jgi:hypothetical protein
VKKEKFFDKLRNGPKNVHFQEIMSFLDGLGFINTASGTGHYIYKKPGIKGRINIQNRGGFVPSYQVRQFIKIIESNKIL